MIDRRLFGPMSLIVAWFDVWVGAYWNPQKHRLYLMIPFIGIAIDFGEEPNRG